MSTDILTLCLGLALGSFLGALTLPVGRIELGLGSVALLLVGVVLSAVRARNPTFGGPFPEPARKLFEDLGLNVFVAVLGLNSGMGILQASQEGALLPILGSSVLIGLLPAVLGWAVGQYWLKMNAAELMGAVAGARSSSTAMRAAVESTASNAPAIAYPVTFAVASVLLTVITYSLAVLN